MSAQRASPPALKLRRRVDLARNNALLHAADFSFKWIYFRNYCDLSTSLALDQTRPKAAPARVLLRTKPQ